MAALERTTIGEVLHWSYANLAMAHAAVTHGVPAYGRVHFMIRARLYKGLRTNTMNMGPLADDERLKLILPQACAYCASRQHLAADHIVPKHLGGPDVGDNLIWACRHCNSSKGAKDLLAWYATNDEFPPLLLLRRYLKLAIELCTESQMMDRPLGDASVLRMEISIPFRSRKTSAASSPVRLFPSTNGWFFTTWKRYAAAIWNRSP